MSVTMLTTIDNPYNPITQFDEWYHYDVQAGHNTCAYLARVVVTSDELSDEDQEIAIDDAMNEILNLNINGMYRKVTLEESE